MKYDAQAIWTYLELKMGSAMQCIYKNHQFENANDNPALYLARQED